MKIYRNHNIKAKNIEVIKNLPYPIYGILEIKETAEFEF